MVHTFPKGISSKVNVIPWLEFELTYFKLTVQHFRSYAMETPYSWILLSLLQLKYECITFQ